MGEDVYVRLREFLDKLPGGYPATEDGVELKILKKLFTEEDAELVMKLSPLPEPVDKIAQRLEMDPAEAEETLERLAKEGSIYRVRLGGKPHYMAIQFVVGIYEFHLNSIDRELAELMEEYLPVLGKVWKDVPTKQLRVAPSVGAVDAAPAVGTYDRVRELIKEQDLIAVAPCICRKEQGLMDNECERPHEVCMSFGFGADYYIENEMGRKIDREEAIAILDKAEEAGLVLSPSNSQQLMNVCCCCECCCGVLRTLKTFDRPADYVASSFQARIDPDLCSACGTCVDRCQIDAIIEGDTMAVDEKRCIGCGLCVSTCPEEAIAMVEKPGDKPDIPKSYTDLGMRILKDRGILK